MMRQQAKTVRYLLVRASRILGLTQKELSEVLGVSPATVFQWMSGNHAPKGQEKILRLRRDLLELLGEDDESWDVAELQGQLERMRGYVAELHCAIDGKDMDALEALSENWRSMRRLKGLERIQGWETTKEKAI